jgi:predicted nuclease of predicted toxin-antitoxin system
MRLLIDMNLSPRWQLILEHAGLEAVHWSELGTATAADVEVMSYANAGGFTVLTHDLDFGAILAATKGNGPSVIQLRADDTSPEANAATLVAAIRQCGPELEAGALLTLDVARVRLTLLPLRS